MKNIEERPIFPAQHQDEKPGIESKMNPRPIYDDPNYKPNSKLNGKIAIVTGGDSGIGRAVSVSFAKEGASVVVVYLNEHGDAEETQNEIRKYGGKCILLSGDVGSEDFCKSVVSTTMKELGQIDIIVNNVAEQQPQSSLLSISEEQLTSTFKTNVFSFFFMSKAALPHLKAGASIINTTSVTAYRGSDHLLDYSSTKGAIVTFTRSLSQALADKNIRVNAVAPGPIWTPLIPSTFSAEEVATFGSDVPMKRAGQPFEVAPSFVFLASTDSTYMTGQVLHPNGGEIINS